MSTPAASTSPTSNSATPTSEPHVDQGAQHRTQPTTLPSLADQVDRLVANGIPELTGIPAEALRDFAEAHGADHTNALLVINREHARPSQLASLLTRAGKPGFVVADMTDVDDFAPTDVEAPDAAIYLVHDLDRGDHLANWSPAEAIPEIAGRDRSPVLLHEGIFWVLQSPDVLERNLCFMTVGSRLRKPNGKFDSRTPAIWISNGTGRDGAERRNAPKVGWCWWNNRHTWLGFASASHRSA